MIAQWFCERHPQCFLLRTQPEARPPRDTNYRHQRVFCKECHREKFLRVRLEAEIMEAEHAMAMAVG